MSSFERCVAFRESTDTPTDPDGLFGILPSTWASLGYSGTAGQASVGQQKTAFNRLYAAQGHHPLGALRRLLIRLTIAEPGVASA